jgi:hypothetical protein
MKILYFDCFSGISGDMALGALLDLGLDCDAFIEELAKLGLFGFDLDVKKATRHAISGTDVDVILHGEGAEAGEGAEDCEGEGEGEGSGPEGAGGVNVWEAAAGDGEAASDDGGDGDGGDGDGGAGDGGDTAGGDVEAASDDGGDGDGEEGADDDGHACDG